MDEIRPLQAGFLGAQEPLQLDPPVKRGPANSDSNGTVHMIRSIIIVAGVYVVMALLALLQSANAGKFPFVSANQMLVLVALGPTLTAAGKDYWHWVASGQWDRAQEEDTDGTLPRM